MAKGNSGDMVIKDNDSVNRRSKVSQYHLQLKEVLHIKDEIWKPIVIDRPILTYYDKSLYEVSTYGRVRNTRTGHILQSYGGNSANSKGQRWQRVTLCLAPNEKIRMLVHRLVALAFIPNDDLVNKTQVNHIDGNPENNYVDNLEWVTPNENMQHAFSHNLVTVPQGSDRGNAIFTEDDVRKICWLMTQGLKAKRIYEVMYDENLSYNPELTRERINHLMKHLRHGTHWKAIARAYNVIEA